jgi:hypothetical protein
VGAQYDEMHLSPRNVLLPLVRSLQRPCQRVKGPLPVSPSRAGRSGDTAATADCDHDPLVAGERKRDVVGDLEDHVDRLPPLGIRRHREASGRGAGAIQRYGSGIRVDGGVLVPEVSQRIVMLASIQAGLQ